MIRRPRQNDQLRAGPVQFGVGLSYSLVWNDNVNNTDTGRDWDLMHRPVLNLSAGWPATQNSMLSFAMGVGYTAYTRNSDLDRLYISPNSELAWDIPVRDFVFTLYDRFSYSEDVLSQPALSGTAQFPRFDNTAGVRDRGSPDKWFVQAGYGHENYFTTESEL